MDGLGAGRHKFFLASKAVEQVERREALLAALQGAARSVQQRDGDEQEEEMEEEEEDEDTEELDVDGDGEDEK